MIGLWIIAVGNQVIDQTFRMPYEALEPLQMTEYAEMDAQFAYLGWFKTDNI